MSPNTFFEEAVDPHDGIKKDFVLKAEHIGRYQFAKAFIKKRASKIVYDVGSGNGYGSYMMSESARIYGFDKAIQQSTEKVEFHTLDFDRKNLEDYCHHSVIPRPSVITCFETLEHLKDPRKLLSEFFKLLPKKGALIVSVPNAQFEPKKKGRSKNKFHLHLFYPHDIHALLRSAGFRIVEKRGQPFTNIVIHYIKWLLPLLNLLFLGDKQRLAVGSKLLAYPTKFLTSYSYSTVVVAEK